MRWTIVALILAVALILDQLKFNGYYRMQTFNVAGNVASGVMRSVR